MGKLDRLLKDGLCPLMPMWNTMLILEFTFISLLLISLFLNRGQPSPAIYFSLVFIVPTTGLLLGLIYYCKREQAADPFRSEESDPSREDPDSPFRREDTSTEASDGDAERENPARED
jgi:hypothetical protein